MNEYAIINSSGNVLGIFLTEEKFNVRDSYEFARGGVTRDALRQKNIGVNRVSVKLSQSAQNLKAAAETMINFSFDSDAECFI